MKLRNVLWRRLDAEGMDACRFGSTDDGWEILGTAIYLAAGRAARLDYRVACDPDWRTTQAHVVGWMGGDEVALHLLQAADRGWMLNGDPLAGVQGLLDVDLGFTPATNTNAIRRLGPRPGETVETTAVWLDPDDGVFKPLRQIYRRLSPTSLYYESPSHGYAAELRTDDFGIVRSYPGLWTAIEPEPSV